MKNQQTPVVKNYAADFVIDAVNDYVTRDFFVTAGLGSGKTHGLCQFHYHRVMLNKGVKYSFFVEPIYRLIKAAAIPTYRKVLTSCGLKEKKHFEVVYSGGMPTIRFKTGHEVLFLSAERPDMLIAIEAGFGVMDETGSCKPESIKMFQDRIRAPESRTLQRFFGGVPTGLNHYSDLCDSDVLPGWHQLTNTIHVSDNGYKKRYKLSTDKNPYLPEQYIHDLKERYAGNPNALKSFFYGEFAPLFEGLAIPSYNPTVHDIDDMMPDPRGEIDLTFDFNNSPMAWIANSLCSFDDIDGSRVSRYVAHDCSREGYGKLREVLIEFAARFPPHIYYQTPINVYGDRTGHAQSHKIELTDYQQIKQILGELGFQNIFIRQTSSLMLESDTLEALDRLFQNNLYFICKSCSSFKRSLSMTKLISGQRKIEKPPGEKHTHWLDAAKYWAYAKTKKFTTSGNSKVLGCN